MHNGAPVQPDADGCCVGMTGIGVSGYATCASEPTTGGVLFFPDLHEEWTSFTCDRHSGVLEDPHPLTPEDIEELNRRRRLAVELAEADD